MIRTLILLSLLAPTVSAAAEVTTQPGKVIDVYQAVRHWGVTMANDVPIVNPAGCPNADGFVWSAFRISPYSNIRIDSVTDALINDINVELTIASQSCLFDQPVFTKIRLLK